ncbi:MarP family serine protease [Paractinoplanes brasiliensis]|uniref:Colicin V production protein n=1 Tax=Paractinoplanes brasiliensis TaxID=52695 RepID=A0A4R6JT52_9ACTN|nr:MarP family serine protease [Actinoplanes brasiliensis]TDO39810.1 colicin V production protein [Actinoplanes brasiliensis]GID31426.1 serine protease [Actinoplanes brasiliensis]
MVDGILILLMLIFAISGYRQGFVIGALSFGGFFSGVLIGLQVGPLIADRFSDPSARLVVSLVTIFALAVLGQTLAGWLGTHLRRAIQSRPLQRADDAGGAAISLVAVLLVAWLIAVPLGSTPFPALNKEVRNSAILGGINSLMPDQAQALSAALRDTLDTSGFPDVFGGLTPTQAKEVAAPDPALKGSQIVQKSKRSVIKVLGTAPSCSRRIEGSGFVYAAERVMTNAHVVAGTRETEVEVNGRRLPATVVVYDPARDLAVLHVPGLTAPVMPFVRSQAKTGTSAIVLGYPQDGPYDAQSARVRDVGRITGPDIYDARDVTREIYTIRSLVRSGNSGGPLISPNGQVLGVIFAAAADDKNTGFALTANEAAPVAQAGLSRTRGVRTGECA